MNAQVRLQWPGSKVVHVLDGGACAKTKPHSHTMAISVATALDRGLRACRVCRPEMSAS